MISRTKIIEHYKKHFMFPDNEILSEDYMIDIDWAESLISDLVEKPANDAESKDGKLPIPHVVGRSEQLICPECENPYPHSRTDGSYSCEDCGHKWAN